MTDIFDFGFTAVDESELEAVRKATAEVNNTSAEVEALENKLNNLYNAILPLLSNLKANPEKDYIYWPDRYEKLDAFADKLHAILTGE